MKPLATAFLFATTTLPLFAQRYEPASLPPAQPAPAAGPIAFPGAPFEVRLEATREKHLMLHLSQGDVGRTWIGVVLAAMEESTIQIDGLPPLLVTDAIVAAGFGEDAMTFDMGPAMLPFPVFLQGVAITSEWIGASGVVPMPKA